MQFPRPRCRRSAGISEKRQKTRRERRPKQILRLHNRHICRAGKQAADNFFRKLLRSFRSEVFHNFLQLCSAAVFQIADQRLVIVRADVGHDIAACIIVRQMLFELDEDCEPIHIAGVPPDAFSDDGQRWGNPLYRWDIMEENDFAWWRERMKANASLYDVIRIDHFIGIVNYWSIAANFIPS